MKSFRYKGWYCRYLYCKDEYHCYTPEDVQIGIEAKTPYLVFLDVDVIIKHIDSFENK